MSRVVQTELLEGAIATAADFNATLASWNAATAAGQINGSNFREEGLDVTSFAAGSVTTTVVNGSIRFSDSTFPIGVWSDVNASEIGPFPDGPVLLHLSVVLRKDDLAGPGAGVRLASSATPGGVATAIAQTQRVVFMRIATNTPITAARLDRSVTVSYLFTVGLTSRYIRVQAENSVAGNLIVQGNVFGQVIAK